MRLRFPTMAVDGTYDAVRAFCAQLAVALSVPLTVRLPVMLTLPVNWWVSVSCVPNFVEPVTSSVEAVMYCTASVCAVIVPVNRALDAVMFCLTKKLSAEEAVRALMAHEEVLAKLELTEKEAVPVRAPTTEPVKDPVTTARLPEETTLRGYTPNFPILTSFVAKASMTGRPDMVLTENSELVRSSDTVNSLPLAPSTESSSLPEPIILKRGLEPETKTVEAVTAAVNLPDPDTSSALSEPVTLTTLPLTSNTLLTLRDPETPDPDTTILYPMSVGMLPL